MIFDSSRVVRAVIRQVAALGQFMPLQRHNVPSVRLFQKSRGSHKPRHTGSYSTACSIRSNAKWRPSHRTPKLLFVLLPVAFGVCGRKRLPSIACACSLLLLTCGRCLSLLMACGRCLSLPTVCGACGARHTMLLRFGLAALGFPLTAFPPHLVGLMLVFCGLKLRVFAHGLGVFPVQHFRESPPTLVLRPLSLLLVW